MVLQTERAPRQRGYIGKVQSSGQHLLGIVNDILDFSKVEAGKLTLEREEFDLDKVLEHVAALITVKAGAKGLELVFDVPPDVPRRLLGDSLRIRQILINFANNAVKYTDRGEIVIAVRLEEIDSGEALLKLSVRDTVHHAKYGGTGLGLAISKKLAQLMGGEVGVHSRVGEGSTFWFTLRAGVAGPLFDTAVDASVRPVPAQDALAGVRGSRILLVEDNEINQIVACELLRDAGMRVDIADNGQIALQMAVPGAYDLVLMDMQMPVMDGVTATGEIRKLPHGAKLPIVAMTANAMQRDRERCIEAGMDDYLAKPIDLQQLHAMLLKWLKPAMPVTPQARRPVLASPHLPFKLPAPAFARSLPDPSPRSRAAAPSTHPA